MVLPDDLAPMQHPGQATGSLSTGSGVAMPGCIAISSGRDALRTRNLGNQADARMRDPWPPSGC
jgi:hypothetical protein